MRKVLPYAFIPVCLSFLLAAWAAAPSGIATLKQQFLRPPDDARIMMRWWWFGPAVAKPELERELRVMKAAGIGGVEIQPVYPVTVDGNFPYLSDEFIGDLRFANDAARQLGLRVDITLGSGWPYGGPHIPVDLASPRLRVDRAAQPRLADGEKLIATVDGASFISSHTRQMVKRAGVGAEGFVLDHYSLPAIEKHLSVVGDRLMQAFGQNPPYAVFSDSLEVYGTDWSGDFLEQFQKRRGYDLKPHLAALAGDAGPTTAAIRRDWGKTLTELCNERYLTPVREWAKRHGTRFRSQTYGTPPVVISSNDLVDLPEGEGSQWRTFTSTRWASSGSHLYGRPVTSSETWTWTHSPVFRATPLDLKAEADFHFLQGVNQLVGHGFPYSPPQAGEPGWHFYAAGALNDHNPWWIAMPDMALYFQRISFLLRQGQPVSDVAVYMPTDDAYARFALGRTSVNETARALLAGELIPQILDAGYNFDLIDDGAIARNGIPYPALVLPNVERIPLATYQKLDEYMRKGGIVIATRRAPSLAPGLQEAETDGPKIQALSRSLFEASGARGKLVTDDAKLGETLRAALPPDLTKAPEIGFVHRKLPFADIYFLANTSNHPVRSQAEFRIKGVDPASWNPFTGKIAKAASGNKVDLDLAPYESRVIVFSNDRLPDPSKSSGPAPAPVDLSAGWRLTFPGAQPIAMDRLASWTENGTRRFFSGQAAYEKTIRVEAPLLKSGRAVYLDFGEGAPVAAQERRSGSGMRAMLESPIREAALVSVNGKPAGSVWTPPYEIDLTAFLRPGENTLRVVVGNLAINELANQPLPNYKPLIAKYGDRFQDQDMVNLQPLPSGLLGPVRLIAK